MSEQDPQTGPASGAAEPAGADGSGSAAGAGNAAVSSETLAGAAGERRRASERLASQAASGGITLDEFAQRAIAIERAASADELRALVAEAPSEEVAPQVKDSPRWLFNVFGGTDQRGRWRLGRHLRILAFLGGASLDLGAAQPAAPECVISVVALLGGVELTAPPGVTVQLSGISLLGGKTDERTVGPSLPGSPLIRVRALAVLGGVKIAERKPSRMSE